MSPSRTATIELSPTVADRQLRYRCKAILWPEQISERVTRFTESPPKTAYHPLIKG
jgi:hypothetical protein